jgi:hypothetical protein
MVDRNDIDALLIGSLYGELSSADEARLKAHLESHPADRTALEGLSRARDAVRASRIFELQAEPSQSVSALLLQEAARRAPRKARQDDDGREGWFARLRRSFLMSPAFAAAAMLVVVIGAASTLYMRKGDHFATSEAPETAALAAGSAYDPPSTALASEPGVTATAPAPAQAQAPEPSPDSVPFNPADGRRRDAYRVGLTDGKVSSRTEEQAKSEAGTGAAPAPPRRAQEAAANADKPKLARQAGPSSLLEVSTPQRAPKELDEARPMKTATKGRAPRREYARPGDAVAPAAEPAITAKLGNAPAPAARAPSAAPATPSAPAVAQDFARAPTAPTGGAAGGAVRGGVDADFAWAKEQHSRLVTQVKAGRCGAAAGTAVALSNRAPGYYQQNVEGDREVKSCLAYINAERERAAERAQRARATTRRVTDEDAAASKKAAAPRKKTPTKATAPKSPPAKADTATTKGD